MRQRLACLLCCGLALSLVGCESLLEPQARVTPGGGPSIGQAQAVPYYGPKARVAVIAFDNKTGRGYQMGEGMADMLATELFNTNRFIVLERQEIGAVTAEQDLARSGRVQPGTGAATGLIEGAELLVKGSITEFEPNYQGGGLGVIRIHRRHPGGAGLRIGQAHIAIDMRVIDARTSRIVAAMRVQGRSTDLAGAIGGIIGGGSSRLGIGLSAYRNQPMEKAVRVCIANAVRFVVSQTPAAYYHLDEQGRPVGAPGAAVPAPAPGGVPPVPPQPTQPAPGAQPAAPQPPQGQPAGQLPAQVYISLATVRVYQQPNPGSNTVATLARGTALGVQAEQGDWYAVQLADGQLGWILKAFTTTVPPQ